MQPFTSVLLENTSRPAPANRCIHELPTAKTKSHLYLFQQQSLQLISAIFNPETICGIDDPYQSIGLLKIIPPVWPQRLLSADIPDVELVSVLVSSRLQNTTFAAWGHPLKSIVLMINPRVGLTVLTSSFIILLTIVVLPALSRPLHA